MNFFSQWYRFNCEIFDNCGKNCLSVCSEDFHIDIDLIVKYLTVVEKFSCFSIYSKIFHGDGNLFVNLFDNCGKGIFRYFTIYKEIFHIDTDLIVKYFTT